MHKDKSWETLSSLKHIFIWRVSSYSILGFNGFTFLCVNEFKNIKLPPELKVTSKDLTESPLTKHFGDPQDSNLKTARFVVGGCRNNAIVHKCSMDHECLHLLSKGQVGWVVQGLVDTLSVSVPNALQNEGYVGCKVPHHRHGGSKGHRDLLLLSIKLEH